MKKIITMLFLLAVTLGMNNKTIAQVNSVSLNGSAIYSNIEDAYAAILPGFVTPQLIEILPAYDGSSELFPISFALVAGTSTITIMPQAGNTGEVVTGSSTDYLFRLNGCSNVIIDGRPGGVTSTAADYLTINNTGLGGNAGTVGFVGADDCILQYVNATATQGTLASTGARCINILGATGDPSNRNIIQNCVVRGGLRGIQNFGLNGTTINQSCIIRNNDVAQFFNIGSLLSNDSNTLVQNNKYHFTSAITTIAGFLVGIQTQGVRTKVDQNEITGFTSLNATAYLHMTNFGINNSYTRNKIHSNSTDANTTNVVVGMQFSGSGTTTFTENEIYNLSQGAPGTIIGMNVASNGSATDNTNIIKNKISGLKTLVGARIEGIRGNARAGNTLNIVDNNISIRDPNNAAIGIFGIYSTWADTTNADYNTNIASNSVYIGGENFGTVGFFVNSAGIFRDNNGDLSVFNQHDNNVLNKRFTSDANPQIHIGFWIDTLTGTRTLDNNNYYASDTALGFAAFWYDSLFTNADLAAYQGYVAPEEANTTFGNAYFLKLTMNFEACPDKSPVTVELRSATSPYNVVESASGIAGGNFGNVIHFSGISDGTPYWVVVKSVNMVETWSSSTITFTDKGSSYDFTTALSQAYGSNQKMSGGIPSVYQGDVNQDGSVSLTDVTLTYNEAVTFTTSPGTDFDCSGSTDLSDIILAFNNQRDFVSVQMPPLDFNHSKYAESDNVNVNANRTINHRTINIDAKMLKSQLSSDAVNSGLMDR